MNQTVYQFDIEKIKLITTMLSAFWSSRFSGDRICQQILFEICNITFICDKIIAVFILRYGFVYAY